MELNLKVLIVGNGMVGKTTLINRFTKGITVDRYKKTIGAGAFVFWRYYRFIV
jgi:GTPase SAR1 family protein